MNRHLLSLQTPFLLSACLALSISACSSGSSSQPASHATNQIGQSANSSPAAWQISLKSACNGVTDNSCRGQYGFTVDANGNYKVGPAAHGEVITGQIAADKFQALVGVVKPLMERGASFAREQSCADLGSVPSPDTLTFEQGTKQHALLSVEQDQSCYEIANTAEIDSLHQAVSALASVYYPDVFPDACSDSVALVQQQYALVQSCSSDADCAYVNLDLGSIDSSSAPSLNVLPAQGNAAVFSDTDTGVCSAIQPVVVANGARLQANSATIIKAIQSAETACSARIYENNCSGNSFDSSQAPSCVHHQCRANIAPANSASPAPASFVVQPLRSSI